jgi:hypothetical protein
LEKTLAPLRRYLRDHYPTELRLSLGEIEEIVGQRLPHGAAAARWWTGVKDPKDAPHQSVWTALGYEATMSGFAPVVRFRACDADRSPMAFRDRAEFVFPTTPLTHHRSKVWRRDGVVQRAPGKHGGR